jgi:hypothetical protein
MPDEDMPEGWRLERAVDVVVIDDVRAEDAASLVVSWAAVNSAVFGCSMAARPVCSVLTKLTHGRRNSPTPQLICNKSKMRLPRLKQISQSLLFSGLRGVRAFQCIVECFSPLCGP